ncbi:TPA: hypothetical protein ACFOC0_000561, partial [Neisseria meningitidis]
NLNRYGKARQRRTGLNLIHYSIGFFQKPKKKPLCILDGFPLIPYGASVFPASYFPLGIPALVVVQLYFYGIFSRYFRML